MATTWGSNSWGDNSWSSDQNNIDVSGISATFNIGQAQYVPVSGWGNSSWGTLSYGVNFANADADVTGIGLSANQGEETITTEINGGWGRLEWGNLAWGEAYSVQLSGQQLNTTTNSVGVGIASFIDVTGQPLTITQDDPEILITVDAFPTGEELNTTSGSVSFTISGSVTLSGQELTANDGTAELDANTLVDLTGQPLTIIQGDESITANANVFPNGQELTANDGTADLDANTIVEVSATSASSWGYKSAWGFGVYGNQQITTLAMAVQENDVDPAPDAEAFGQAMAMFQGEETITAGANVFPTGQELTATQGTATLDANTQVDVTGQAMAMQEGDETVTGNANVLASGNALTMATGSLRTLIWNQVNTGTAPVVPPGWQEVDTAA